MDTEDHKSPFSEWIRSPQTMIALSAVLLSVCGLFVSIYETSLIREQQRASVWPNVEVQPSLRPDDLKIFVQNTGIGPARIIKAAVIYGDEVKKNWKEIIESVDYEGKGYSDYQSLIKGRVMPPSSSQELIFRIESSAENREGNLAEILGKAINEETLDVALCYCSVYDECWTTYMSDIVKRAKVEQVPKREERIVESCETMEESGI